MGQNPIASIMQFLNPKGTLSSGRGDPQGSMYMSQRHGERYATAYNGNIGWAANQAAVTTSAGLATTYLGICLSNPAGSGKNLAVGKVAATINVAPAALTFIGLITGFAAGGVTVHTTPLTVQNGLVGQSAAALVGLADAACTLVGTPTWADFLVETPSATGVPLTAKWDYEGGLILPPGAYAAIGTSIAGPTSGFWGMIQWEENPV